MIVPRSPQLALLAIPLRSSHHMVCIGSQNSQHVAHCTTTTFSASTRSAHATSTHSLVFSCTACQAASGNKLLGSIGATTSNVCHYAALPLATVLLQIRCPFLHCFQCFCQFCSSCLIVLQSCQLSLPSCFKRLNLLQNLGYCCIDSSIRLLQVNSNSNSTWLISSCSQAMKLLLAPLATAASAAGLLQCTVL